MKVFVVGLRVNVDGPECDFYTLWFEGKDGRNRVATVDGRLQWVRRLEDVTKIRDSLYSWDGVPDAVEAICGMSSALHALSRPAEGDPNVVALALDLLDDFVFCCPDPLPHQHKKMLDAVAVGLFEGRSLAELVPPERFPDVVEAIMASLGRILAFSDFRE